MVPQQPLRGIVVGVDGSAASTVAVKWAARDAAMRRAPLHLVHVVPPMGIASTVGAGDEPLVSYAKWRNIEEQEKAVLAERLSGWQERYPDVAVRKLVVCDRPAFRLLEQAADAQLIVVGSHGRGGFPGMLLGSVSTAVVNAAPIPIIVARALPDSDSKSGN